MPSDRSSLDTLARSLADTLAAEPGLVLVVTGAGVSLASGIPTFRGSDPGAVWHTDVREAATYRYFRRDPVGSWRWYRERFAKAATATPNAAHLALAALERWQIARGRHVLLVTQNIDTLHEQARSINLVKVHGSADRARCASGDCDEGTTHSVPLADLDFTAFATRPTLEAVPRCAACGDLMRPHVLWFDEYYGDHTDYEWSRVMHGCATARLVLTIGTSLSVGVTDVVLQAAAHTGAQLVNVDPAPRPGALPDSATHLSAPAEALLPLVCAALSAD